VKPLKRNRTTNEALGIASIIETAARGTFKLDQDLKGRWHVYSAPANGADTADHIERHLAFESYG
jgi:hypothetical protein